MCAAMSAPCLLQALAHCVLPAILIRCCEDRLKSGITLSRIRHRGKKPRFRQEFGAPAAIDSRRAPLARFSPGRKTGPAIRGETWSGFDWRATAWHGGADQVALIEKPQYSSSRTSRCDVIYVLTAYFRACSALLISMMWPSSISRILSASCARRSSCVIITNATPLS